MKKTIKLIIISIFIWLIFFITDYSLVKNKKDPIFCLKVEETKTYNYKIGLFYGVYEIYDDTIAIPEPFFPQDDLPNLSEYKIRVWFFR